VRRRRAPEPPWPPHLATFDPGSWLKEWHWRLARFGWWKDHEAELPGVDPVELLAEEMRARHAAP
jgi:hypothetical protein